MTKILIWFKYGPALILAIWFYGMLCFFNAARYRAVRTRFHKAIGKQRVLRAKMLGITKAGGIVHV